MKSFLYFVIIFALIGMLFASEFRVRQALDGWGTAIVLVEYYKNAKTCTPPIPPGKIELIPIIGSIERNQVKL